MGDFHLSVFSRADGAGAEDSAWEDLLRGTLHETGQAERWQVFSSEGLWCSVQPNRAL